MATTSQQFAKIAWLFGLKLAVRSGNGFGYRTRQSLDLFQGAGRNERDARPARFTRLPVEPNGPELSNLMGRGHGNSRLGGRRRGIGRTEKMWAKIGFSPR